MKDAEAKQLAESRVLRMTPDGTPYLHFDEELYMQKDKIKRKMYKGCRREFPLEWATYFLYIITIGFILFIWALYPFTAIPFRICERRKAVYQIYLDDCKAFKEELQNKKKELNLERQQKELDEFRKFKLSHSE